LHARAAADVQASGGDAPFVAAVARLATRKWRISRKVELRSPWSTSQSWLLQPRLAEPPSRLDNGSDHSNWPPRPKSLRPPPHRSRLAGRFGLASSRTTYEYRSHRQISKGNPQSGTELLPSRVIIAALNSTVNVTCCLSTLPFSGSRDAAVPELCQIAIDFFHHRWPV
jgi:hypothetical protein